MIDPTLIHYSFAFCASHVHGNRPDGVGSITHEEKEKFQDIKERLRVLLEYQITNFRWVLVSQELSLCPNAFSPDIVFRLDVLKVL